MELIEDQRAVGIQAIACRVQGDAGVKTDARFRASHVLEAHRVATPWPRVSPVCAATQRASDRHATRRGSTTSTGLPVASAHQTGMRVDLPLPVGALTMRWQRDTSDATRGRSSSTGRASVSAWRLGKEGFMPL